MKLWNPGCAIGDSTIALEFKLSEQSSETGVCNSSRQHSRVLSLETIAIQPGDSFVYKMNLISYWSLPFDVADQQNVDVFVRFVYHSTDAFNFFSGDPPGNWQKSQDGVWTGIATSPWQKVTIRNFSGRNTQSLEAARSNVNIIHPNKTPITNKNLTSRSDVGT